MIFVLWCVITLCVAMFCMWRTTSYAEKRWGETVNANIWAALFGDALAGVIVLSFLLVIHLLGYLPDLKAAF